MRHVAFLRNVNQGQRGHPSTSDLVDAFESEGASHAVPFQSNGTIVFTAPDAAALALAVRERLAGRGVFDDAIHVRSVAFIARIVLAHAGEPDGRRRELTLFERGRDPEASTLLTESVRRRCRIADAGDGWAVVLNERDQQSNGTPTLQAVLGTPATSRGLPTLARLIDRFGE